MKKIEYFSETNNVMIGNDDIQFYIPNENGDCRGYVIILDIQEKGKELIPSEARWHGCVSGEGIKVFTFESDGSKPYVLLANGRYGVYSNEGTIYLQRYSKVPDAIYYSD